MEAQRTIKLRRRLPAIWILLLLIADIVLPGRIWTTLLIGLGGLFIIAYLWSRGLCRGLSGDRRLRFGWVSVGDRLSEQLSIQNHSVFPAFWVEVVDHSNVPDYQAAVVRSVGGGEILNWRQSAICHQRGLFHLGPWALQTSDPFGVFQVTIVYDKTEQIIIHPPVDASIPISLPAGQSHGRVKARERSWHATLNAATVRDYQPKDPFRWIHWPTTAHRGSLYVRQFDLDAAGDIWILIDLQSSVQVGSGPEGTEEHAVLLAAALASLGLRQNRAVGLATYGQQPELIPPGRGRGQEWRILRALALATADGQNDLARAIGDLRQVARRGSAAVIITSSGTVDFVPELLRLAQSGIQANVVLLDRATFGDMADSLDYSGQGLRDAVRQLGIESHLIKQGEIDRPDSDEDRRGFWEFRVTGTGRVVTIRSPFDT